jgi:hypothetical protein
MSGHKIFVQIGNASTGEVLENRFIDEEHAIVDKLRHVLDDLHAKYRQRYPVGLRTTPKIVL